MAWFALYLGLAGIAGALRLQELQDVSQRRSGRAVTSSSRDLFGFVQPQYTHTPYGYQRVQTYAASEIAPFWTFPTNDDFVLDSHGIQRKLRSHRFSGEDQMEMAGTEQETYVSDHEAPRDVPTRPKLGKPGEWARGEVPGREQPVRLGFVPVQIYSQSRRYDSEEHLPRTKAVEEAEDKEELIAAPRLREVLRNKKLHEVYEEEGYEDLGYDHGGYNHHGVKVEKAVKNEKGVYRKPPPPPSGDTQPEGPGQDGPSQEQQVESRIVNNVQPNPAESNKVITGQPASSELANRMDVTIGYSEDDDVEPKVMNKQGRIVFPGQSTRRHYTTLVSPIVVAPDIPFLATASMQNPQIVHQVATFEPSSFYYDTSPSSFTSSSPIHFATTLNTYASLINENFSSPILHTPLIVDVPEENYNTTNEYTLSRSDRNSQDENSGKVYENHRSTNNSTTRDSQKSITESTSNHSPRTSGRRRGASRGSSTYQSSVSQPKQFSAPESTTSQPKTSNKKYSSTTPMKKSKIYSNLTRGSSKYNPEDDSQWTPTVGTQNIRHPSLPIDSGEGKGDDSPQLTKDPSTTGNIASQVIKVPDDVAPTKDPSANAKYVEQLTLAHFSAPVYVNPIQGQSSNQDKRLSDLARQLNSPQREDKVQHSRRKKRSAAYHSKEKYPYYDSPKSISKDSPLKYASDSKSIPKKTYGGMEFYESKENIKCDGPVPPKKITPEKEEDGEWEEDPMPEGERVKGVGNAIDCYKRKFFGRDPLDNPFFKEDKVHTETDSYEYSGREYGSEESRKPLVTTGSDSDIRKIMFIENPEIFRNNSESESDKRSINSEEDSEESVGSVEDLSLATKAPPRYSSNQYSVYESVEEPKHNKETAIPKRSNKQPKPTLSTYILKEKKKALPQYVMQPISVYSIISNNDIPPHHAPLLIPENGPKFSPIPVRKESLVRYPSEKIKEPPIPKVYSPPNYNERKILVTKREADTDLWTMINPLKWWWPNLFDSRRDEPRYRRSSDLIYDEPPIHEMTDAPTETKPSTSNPISLAEFKVKFNISNSKQTPKKISTRLTGGFLNRNPDITDAIEDIIDKKPTEASTSSTIATTTVKPKVIFPRAKIPRRKVKPPKKSGNISETISESATTTTTTTQPPSTTTRMYKPKRVIPKTFGRGSFNAFTVLTTSKEITPTVPFDRSFLQEEDLIRRKQEEDLIRRKQEEDLNRKKQEEDLIRKKQEEDLIRKKQEEVLIRKKQDEDSTRRKPEGESGKATSDAPQDSTTAGSNIVPPPDKIGENQTLTYMVDPVSGVGSWGEQRKWKPKRKRPNTPSIYSYLQTGNATFKGAAFKKRQRDLPDRSKEVYAAGQLTTNSGESPSLRRPASTETSPIISRPVEVKISRARTNKPPPKYILEPDKRRYYYAKV